MPRKKKLPVPEENRSPKGPGGSDPEAVLNEPDSEDFESDNVDQTGDRENIRQNRSNQQLKR